MGGCIYKERLSGCCFGQFKVLPGAEKGLLLHCWCIMSNHLHLIISAKNKDLSGVLRDFKKYTSKQIIAAIQNNQHESRKDWMLRIFRERGESNSRNKEYQFWRQDNRWNYIALPLLCKR